MGKPKGPRKAETYRAARRNAVLRGDPRQPWPGVKTNDQLHEQDRGGTRYVEGSMVR